MLLRTSWSRRSIVARCFPVRTSHSSPKPISRVAVACTALQEARGGGRTTTKGSSIGDFVVHRVHGVGRYLGMETREMFGITRDRLVIEFKGGDRVYVDSEDIGLIRKYSGGEEPRLSKMGGADWEKTRARVRRTVRDIAAELVILYRRRLATAGHTFAPDGPFQQQIEDAFPYEETPDQLQAIAETKADMERAIPMDRLICGDVGYGKTEVTLRAAAKAVFDGTQVAVLVPTTLLATQHGQTFHERFANYPVRVEVLSRFLSRRSRATSSKVFATASSTSSSGPTVCCPRTCGSRTSACWSSTRSNASACSTRSASRRCARMSTFSR